MTQARIRLGISGALVAGALLAQATETPLAQLEAAGGKIGWDGITLGMSSVQVERRTGVTLAMQQSPGSVPSCRAFTVMVERDTLRLTLGFPNSRPGAKLQSIYVQFEGYQVTAKQEALVRELKEKIPGAVFQPHDMTPPPTEAADPAPTYLVAGTETAVRLVAGDGLWITLRNCLE